MVDIIKQAQDDYQRDKTHWATIYELARDDLRFLSDEEGAQWDALDYQDRVNSSRPALTVDQLSQFVHQVANDIRMNTPTINVIPSGTEASVEAAEVIKGIIRNIEYVSGADDAYDTASLNSVKSSIGFIRIDHDYADDESFEQELLIKRVVNPLSVLLDSESVECDGSDAMHCTVLDTMLVSVFKKKYPGRDPVCFDDSKTEKKDGDYVTVAERYEIVEQEREIGANDLGEVEDVQEGVSYKTTRKIKKRIVKRYILSGKEILNETTFPGKYIPYIPVYGEEAWIDGKRHIFSLIRKSKQAQQMYNLWKSLETELLMKQPKAPVMAASGSVEAYADDWKNPDKAAVLRYDAVDKDGNQVRAPERLAPPTIPTGVVNAARATVDDIKATMGLYNASIGQRSNETSGIAIQRRNEEGDVATYHFADNLVRSITHVGRVIVCAIPEVYDTPRIVRIIGEEDEPKEVGINGKTAEGQEEVYDLTRGKYDVRVVTGAPFTTRRQEAVAFFTDIVSKQPDLMQIMGDLLFKNMDFAGAPAMAERMKKVIAKTNPDLIQEEGEEVDPEKEQMRAALQEAQVQMQEMQAQMQEIAKDAQEEIDNMQVEIDNKEKEILLKGISEENTQKIESQKLKIEILKMQLERKKNEEANRIKKMELVLKSKELEMKQSIEIEKLNLEHEKNEQAEEAMSNELETPIATYETGATQYENEND